MINYFQYPNVVGYGVGHKNKDGLDTGRPAIVVMVRQKFPQSALPIKDLIPPQDDEGLVTDVIEVGHIEALRTGKFRPAPGGVSIGHFAITAGTLGTVVTGLDGVRYILSNNHVLANSNEAELGDPILQPGTYDGGGPEDEIAVLSDFVPINFGSGDGNSGLADVLAAIGNGILTLLGNDCRLKTDCPSAPADNVVDAAIALPIDDADVLDSILDIGEINGVLPAFLGQEVRKSGRTTSLTTGTVMVIDAVVNVSYGAGKTARFERQIVSSPMSEGGDSGSLLVDGSSPAAVGLLFAGSDQVTIYNPIDEVLRLLKVTI